MAKYVTKERYESNLGSMGTTSGTDSNMVILNRTVRDYFVIKDKDSIPALYVVNYEANGMGDGFVVISADYRYIPICALVETGNLHLTDTIPSALGSWFGKTVEDIEIVRAGIYYDIAAAIFEWNNWAEELSPLVVLTPIPATPEYVDSCGLSFYYQKGPLLGSTAWGQACTFNEQCPNSGCYNCNSNVVTGCVATAMAQVIHYWAPTTSYNYNYASMPNTYGNNEVQRLMHDAGVSVSMNYGCNESGAFTSDVPSGFQDFNLSGTRSSFNQSSSTDWNKIWNNLNANQPILLGGCAGANHFLFIHYAFSDCHVWVCDGYIKKGNACYSLTSFHMNWGWNETYNTGNNYNGYYNWNNWSPVGTTYNFHYSTDIVYNIHL